MSTPPFLQPDLLRPEHFPVEFGRYRLLGLLGEGGMARVFHAELLGDEGFRKAAAVKVVHAAVAARGEALRRSLINEARTGGMLNHPNIVDTYDFGEVEGLPYIAMELVRGVGLEAVLAQGALPSTLVLEVGAQIAAGLDHAHHLEVDGAPASVVHRDLKPSNIILSRDGLVKVMDFGIAKATTNAYDTTQTGMTKGTPAYMSPEQAAGLELDGRSDLFAFGAILFELATGDRFFHGETVMSLLLAVVRVEELLLDRGRMGPLDDVAPGLGDVVRRCLRRDPADRWADAASIEQALRTMQRALPFGVPLRSFVREFDGVGVGSGRTSDTELGARAAGASAEAGAGASATRVSAAPGLGLASAEPTPGRPVPPTRLQLPAESAPLPPHGSAPTLVAHGAPPERPRSPVAPLALGFGLSLLVLGGGAMAWRATQERAPSAAGVGGGGESAPPEAAPLPPLAVGEHAAEDAGGTGPSNWAAPTSVGATTAERTAAPGSISRAPASSAPASSAPASSAPASSAPASSAPRASVPGSASDHPTSTPEAAPPPRAPVSTASAPPAAAHFGIRSASAMATGRDGDSAIVRFEANVTAGEGAEVVAWFNPPKSRWVARPMRAVSPGRYEVNITFPERSVGKTYWYIVAKPARGGTAATHGTEDRPNTLRLK